VGNLNITSNSAPDGGSTVALLGGVLLAFGALRRKLRFSTHS
jgi:hypothetical protein